MALSARRHHPLAAQTHQRPADGGLPLNLIAVTSVSAAHHPRRRISMPRAGSWAITAPPCNPPRPRPPANERRNASYPSAAPIA
jgi:hypothetical protein